MKYLFILFILFFFVGCNNYQNKALNKVFLERNSDTLVNVKLIETVSLNKTNIYSNYGLKFFSTNSTIEILNNINCGIYIDISQSGLIFNESEIKDFDLEELLYRTENCLDNVLDNSVFDYSLNEKTIEKRKLAVNFNNTNIYEKESTFNINYVFFIILILFSILIVFYFIAFIKKYILHKKNIKLKNNEFIFYSNQLNRLKQEKKSKENIDNNDLTILISKITELIQCNFHSVLVKEKILNEINFLKQHYKNNEVSVLNSLNLILNELNETKKNNIDDLINKSTDSILKTIQLINDNK